MNSTDSNQWTSRTRIYRLLSRLTIVYNTDVGGTFWKYHRSEASPGLFRMVQKEGFVIPDGLHRPRARPEWRGLKPTTDLVSVAGLTDSYQPQPVCLLGPAMGSPLAIPSLGWAQVLSGFEA